MSKSEFTGLSNSGNFNEAVANAIAIAKEALQSDHINYEVQKISGQDGGFIHETKLFVTINANTNLPEPASESTGVALFRIADASTKDFVIKLEEESKIEFARRILGGEESELIHVSGQIVKSSVPYNPGWNYHLQPGSIEFFSNAIEVCDATAQYVEDNLDEVGGALLPCGRWCPWSSALIEEITLP